MTMMVISWADMSLTSGTNMQSMDKETVFLITKVISEDLKELFGTSVEVTMNL